MYEIWNLLILKVVGLPLKHYKNNGNRRRTKGTLRNPFRKKKYIPRRFELAIEIEKKIFV